LTRAISFDYRTSMTSSFVIDVSLWWLFPASLLVFALASMLGIDGAALLLPIVLFAMEHLPADDQLGLCLLCAVAQLLVGSIIVAYRKTVDWTTCAVAVVISLIGCVSGVLIRTVLASYSSQVVLFLFSATMLVLALFVAVLSVVGGGTRASLLLAARPSSSDMRSDASWESVADVPEEHSHSNRSSLSMPRSPLTPDLSERSPLVQSVSSDSFERVHAHGATTQPPVFRAPPLISEVFLQPRAPPKSTTRIEELHDRLIVVRSGEKFRYRIGKPLEAVALTLAGGLLTGMVGSGIGLSLVAVLVGRCRVPFEVAVATALTTSLVSVVVSSIAWLVIDANSIGSLGVAVFAGPGALVGSAVGVWVSRFCTSKFMPAVLVFVYVAVATATLLGALTERHFH
jgi:uncharacterized membrane protein YfcA